MEDDMLEHRIETKFKEPIAIVFNALISVLAERCWDTVLSVEVAPVMPKSGLKYAGRHGQLVRSGEVLECIRPVSIVLLESAHRSAATATVRKRWRIEPLESESLLHGEVKVALNRFANFNRRFWLRYICSDCQSVCAAVQSKLRSQNRKNSGHIGTAGQSTGRTSIVSANISSVNGKPILR